MPFGGLGNALGDAYSGAAGAAEDGLDAGGDFLGSAGDAAGDAASGGADFLGGLWDAGADAAGEAGGAAGDGFDYFADGSISTGQAFVESLGQGTEFLTGGTADWVRTWDDAAADLGGGAGDIINQLPNIVMPLAVVAGALVLLMVVVR